MSEDWPVVVGPERMPASTAHGWWPSIRGAATRRSTPFISRVFDEFLDWPINFDESIDFRFSDFIEMVEMKIEKMVENRKLKSQCSQ